MGVWKQLTGAHHDPQPQPLGRWHTVIVRGKIAGQSGSQRVQEPGGGDVGVGQQPQRV
jgi:hypothetical protein